MHSRHTGMHCNLAWEKIAVEPAACRMVLNGVCVDLLENVGKPRQAVVDGVECTVLIARIVDNIRHPIRFPNGTGACKDVWTCSPTFSGNFLAGVVKLRLPEFMTLRASIFQSVFRMALVHYIYIFYIAEYPHVACLLCQHEGRLLQR